VPKIELAFDLDANGWLRVSAKDLGTGREQSIAVTPSTGLSDDDIDRLINESADMADEDLVRKRIADARNKGEGLLYSSERALAEFGHMLPDIERAELAQEIQECRAELAGDDVVAVEEAAARLEVSAQRVGEAIYAAAETMGTAGASDGT
jgi:molecular chaperone DnaK